MILDPGKKNFSGKRSGGMVFQECPSRWKKIFFYFCGHVDIYMEISSRQQGSFRASVAAEFLKPQQIRR
jgi:hypothetical protein